MNRRDCLAAIGASTAIGFPAVVRAQAPPVRIAADHSDAYALSYFARDAGLFKQAGIEVDIQNFFNSQAALQGLIGGSLDVVAADAVQIGNAVNSGVDIGYFAPSTAYTSAAPATLICVAKDRSVKTAKDLEGRTVGVVALHSLMTVGLEQYLKDNGADGSKVKMVEMNYLPAMDAAVTRGTVDAVILAEPFLSAASDTRILGDPLGPIAKNFLLNGQVSTRKWVAANPETAAKLAKVYATAAAWCNGHHDATATFLSSYLKVPVEKIRAMRRATFATTLSPALVQPVLDMAFRYGQLPKAVNAQATIISV